MIIFDLACHNGHPFEGWFQSSGAFEAQLADALIACPVCGSSEIRRIPSAIHLAGTPAAAPPPVETPAPSSPTGFLRTYRKLVATIMAHSEDVGTRFASEARKIHSLEAPQRSIRGQASDREFKALREEGIEVLKLPVIKNEDLN